MKKLGTILILLAVILLFMFIAKDLVAKHAIEKAVAKATGLETRVEDINIGLFSTKVDAKNIRVMNPSGFEGDMVMIPEVYIDYDLGSLLGGKVKLNEVRFHLSRFNLVKNKEGVINVEKVKVVKSQKKGQEKDTEEGKKVPIDITTLQLAIDRVVYKDYSNSPEPSVKEYEINFQETYRDVKDMQQLASLIISKVLVETALNNLINVDVGELGEDIMKKTEEATQDMMQEGSEEIDEKIKEGTKSLMDIMGGEKP